MDDSAHLIVLTPCVEFGPYTLKVMVLMEAEELLWLPPSPVGRDAIIRMRGCCECAKRTGEYLLLDDLDVLVLWKSAGRTRSVDPPLLSGNSGGNICCLSRRSPWLLPWLMSNGRAICGANPSRVWLLATWTGVLDHSLPDCCCSLEMLTLMLRCCWNGTADGMVRNSSILPEEKGVRCKYSY